jgi:hypothetical protein
MTSMQTSPGQVSRPPDRAQLQELIGSMRVTQLIYVAATLDQRGHSRRKLRFHLSMKGNVSKSGYEIRRGIIIETRIFNENPHIRLFKPYLWLKYPYLSSKNS